MEDIKNLISNGLINTTFVNKLKDFINTNQDVNKLPRLLSYLYSQSSLQSKIREKDEMFIQSLQESVVLLIRSSLTLDIAQNNCQVRASCLRTASNFSVIFHKEGYESNIILDTSVASIVPLIQKNITWTPEELSQTMCNLIAMLSSKLSKNTSKLSTQDRHQLWDNLICLYQPMDDKTRLIFLLNELAYAKSNSCDIYYLESYVEQFTRESLPNLFVILDNYYACYWKLDNKRLHDVVNKILDHIISVIGKNNNSEWEIIVISVYKYLHRITYHITKSNHEELLHDSLVMFNAQLSDLSSLVTKMKNQEQTSLFQKILSSILNHFSFFQIKYLSQFKKTSMIKNIVEIYRNIFNVAQTVRTKDQYLSRKNENLMLYQSWYSCLTTICENLNLDHLHKNFVQALNTANDFTMRMFLLMFNENTTIGAAESDRHDLKSFVLNIGKLTQAVTKLDPKSQNKKMNSYLIKPLMDFFLVIPEKYVDPVAEYMVNVLYNCIKSQTPKDVSSMLSSLEPMIVLVCHSKAFVRSAVKTWARIQLQHKLEHPEYEWIHLCDHLDSIRAQLQVKYPGVTFVDTRDPSFVLRVLKCELDEMLAHRQLEKESSLSYETTIMNRTLSLIQTSPPQDPHLSDVCLSCLSLTYKHDAFSQDNAKLKAYVHELKKTLKTMKHPAENGNFRANPNLDDSVVVKAEQSLVTKNTTLCLLLANCYVMEHIEKVHWKRLAQKKSKSSDDGKASRGISDLDKGIEQVLNDTNVFATSMDVMETLEAVKLLNTVALVLSKIVQMDVVLDLEKISSVTKLDRVTSNILYVGYSYRLYLEGDKEIEFWKLALQLSVLLKQDALFVECVSNLLWLDEGLRPSHLKKADDLINANVKPPIPQHVKTMYQFARIKQALSLNDLSKANEELSLIQLEHTPVPTVHEMLVMYHSWYLKCQLLMRQPELSHSEHAFIVQCCDEAFKCLFKNYDTVNHSTPIVVQVISCYLHITLLITKFHTAHLNPQDGRRILSTLLTFTQDMCLPLWTAQLLSLSACLDVITCNKEDLLFKINCLEQVLTSDVTQKTLQNNINSNKNSTHQNSANSHSNKNSSHQNSANSNANNSQQRPITPPNPVFTRKRGDEAMRDAVVTKQTTISSSLASPRFVSVVSNKLPEFIAHRSCHCFECRNSVYHELLVSLGLLQGLYYQLDGQYELTTFCFQNAEHLLNKLKILKGLPEDQASQWQARLLFYRANLEGILNRAANVLKINQELQLVSSGSDGYFDRYFDMSWQQEQYLMFVGAQLETRPRKVKKYRTPPKSKPLATQAAQFQTPKVSNLNVQSVFGMDTKYPACKFIKDVVTPKAKVRMTLHFDDDEEESDEKCDGIGGKDDGSGGKVDKIDGKDKIGEKVDTIGGKVDTIVGKDGSSIDGKVDKRKGSECTPEKKAKEKVKPRTTARKPRRVRFDEPVIVEEEMEMDAVPWSPMTVKTDTKYKSYSSATKPLTQSTKAPILSTFTPLVNDKKTATPNDLHSNQLSPRSSLSMKKTAPRRKVLFDSDEDDVIPTETDVKDELSKDLCNTENKRTDNAKISQTGNTAKTIRNARNGSSDSQTSSENSEVKARPKTTRRRAILESSETSSETSDEVYTTCRKTQPRKPTEANARSGRHAKAKEERIETSTNKKNVRGINKVSGKCLNQLVDAVEDLVETIGDLKIDADTLSGGPSDDLDISNASSYHSCSPTPEKSAPARRKNKVLCFDNEDIENEPAKTRTTQRTSGETSENRANNPCERSAKRLGTVRETKSRSVKCDSQVLDTRSKLPNPLSHRTHSLETKTMTKTQSSRTQSLETKTSITSLETKTTDQSINSNNNLKTRITKSVSKSVQSECTTVKSNAIANSSRFKKPDPPVSKVMPRRTIRKPSDTIDDDLEVKQRLTNTKVFDKTASENYKVFAKNENSTLKSTSSKKTVEMVSSSRDDQENLPPNASRCKTSRAKLCVEESAPCKTSRAKLCVEELAPCKTSRAKIVIDEVPPKAEKPKRKPRAQFPRSPFIL